jgi:hypothetical protein
VKTILISVLLQILPGPDADSSEIRVMAAVTAEFDSREACKNAIVGMVNLAESSGFKVNSLCAPKDIGKLEVEKPKARPQTQRREPESEHGSAS